MGVKVYRGLYVSEASDLDDDAFIDEESPTEVRTYDPSVICFPQRDFAIGIAIAGLVIILIVIIAILCLLSRRRRRKDLSTTGSSIYSGPYTILPILRIAAETAEKTSEKDNF